MKKNQLPKLSWKCNNGSSLRSYQQCQYECRKLRSTMAALSIFVGHAVQRHLHSDGHGCSCLAGHARGCSKTPTNL